MVFDAERTQVRAVAEERVRELIRSQGIDPLRDHDAIRDAIDRAVADAVGEALASSEALRQGTLYGGVGLLSLSGAIAAAAVATWVFDVANGTLRLPLFDGEAP